MNSARSATLLLAALFGAACAAPRAPEADRGSWTLVAVEFDKALAANAGSLPVYRAADADRFSAEPPRARGSLRFSDSGGVACEVVFVEAVVGLSGRVALQQYPVIQFVGRRSDDGGAAISRGPDEGAPLGTATRLHFERESDTRMRVRAATADRALPYVYVFANDVGVERLTPVPRVD